MATDVRERRITNGWVRRPADSVSARVPSAEFTVLVIDDDPDVLEIAQEFLIRADFRVLTADGGAQALEVFREWGEKIDVVVLDLSMPDMDGDATFDEIRKMRSDVHVVIVSGYSESMAADRFTAAGAADGFLSKPYLPEALIERVRGVLPR